MHPRWTAPTTRARCHVCFTECHVVFTSSVLVAPLCALQSALPTRRLADSRCSRGFVHGLLVVLNDADDHRTGVSGDHGAASALGVKEVLARLEHFVRHSVEARPQVEAEVLATTRTDHVDVPETDPVDHTQPVVFGLGEDGVDGQLQPLGEVLEPGVAVASTMTVSRVRRMLQISSLFR